MTLISGISLSLMPQAQETGRLSLFVKKGLTLLCIDKVVESGVGTRLQDSEYTRNPYFGNCRYELWHFQRDNTDGIFPKREFPHWVFWFRFNRGSISSFPSVEPLKKTQVESDRFAGLNRRKIQDGAK